MSKILAIHGAFSTPRMFNYLKKELDNHSWEFIDYRDKIDNIDNIIYHAQTAFNGSNYTIIGHSMGGLIALSLANHIDVDRLVKIGRAHV